MSNVSKAIYESMAELQAINLAFKQNSLQFFILNNIDGNYFTTYKKHYDFLTDFYEKYSQLPSKETFNSRFPDEFDWVSVSEPEESIVARLREAKKFRDVLPAWQKMGQLLKDEKTDDAIELMGSLYYELMRGNQSKCIDLIDDVGLRYESYMDRVSNPNGSFVTTGLKELDDILGGWDLKNESALVCARTGYGKSWWLIYFAMAAAKAGLRVGYYSGEMEVDLVGYRFDTFLGNISNGSLTHGNESVKQDYENYIDSLNSVVPGHIFCITPDMFDGSVTVAKLRAFIEKYDIQMLCVDQFSLLDDQRHAKTPREQFSNISKDLRALQRIKKIPMISAVQLNRMESDDGPSTRNIAESDRIGQDATTILFVERKDENVVLTVGKARNAHTGDKLTYAWNINKGILHYQPTENDAIGGEMSAEIENSYDDFEKSDSVF